MASPDRSPHSFSLQKAGASLDVSAGAVIIVGIIVLFAGNGGLNVGDLELSLGQNIPSGVKAVSVILAIFLIFFGTALLIEKHITSGSSDPTLRRKIFIPMLVAGSICVTWSSYAIFFQPPSLYSIPRWECDATNSTFSATINQSGLKKHEGKDLVLVVTRSNARSSDRADIEIISSWSPKSITGEYKIHATNSTSQCRLGVEFRISLFAVSPGQQDLKTLQDVEQAEGSEFITYRTVDYHINEVNPRSLLRAIQDLSDDEREYFLQQASSS